MPTIAAIDGYALGTGLELAIACDMMFVTDSSSLQLQEIEIFLNGGVGTIPTLVQNMGHSHTKMLLTSPEMWSGRQAESFGLANKCLVSSRIAGVDNAYE